MKTKKFVPFQNFTLVNIRVRHLSNDIHPGNLVQIIGAFHGHPIAFRAAVLLAESFNNN